jgi:hypothetical protein
MKESDFSVLHPAAAKNLPIRQEVMEMMETRLQSSESKLAWQELVKEHNEVWNPSGQAWENKRKSDANSSGGPAKKPRLVEQVPGQPQTLDELEKNPSIKKIYIISNDIEWCKSHDAEWKQHTKKEIEYDGTPNELEALYRMILCRGGAVISGSTFSSWGAILGPDMNPTSTLVYPLIVGQYAGVENPFNFPSRWIGIKL